MPLRQRNSISRKLTWMNMLVSGAALCWPARRLSPTTRWHSEPAWSGIFPLRLRLSAPTVSPPCSFNDQQSAENTLSALKAAHNILSARIYSADGKLFASYSRDPGGYCRRFLRCLPANWKFIGSRTRRSFWSAPLYSAASQQG